MNLSEAWKKRAPLEHRAQDSVMFGLSSVAAMSFFVLVTVTLNDLKNSGEENTCPEKISVSAQPYR